MRTKRLARKSNLALFSVAPHLMHKGLAVSSVFMERVKWQKVSCVTQNHDATRSHVLFPLLDSASGLAHNNLVTCLKARRMQDHTVALSQSDWNSDGTGNVHLELENSHDTCNPYFTPLVRESKRTNFENAQLKMGHLMDERWY